jgi:hypothetical protein
MRVEDADLFRSKVRIFIEADIAIPAIGQAIDLSFLEEKDGRRNDPPSIEEGTFRRAGRRIFSAGDCVTGPMCWFVPQVMGRAAEKIGLTFAGWR